VNLEPLERLNHLSLFFCLSHQLSISLITTNSVYLGILCILSVFNAYLQPIFIDVVQVIAFLQLKVHFNRMNADELASSNLD
jgi:hypothetical protein